ncbi:MAG: Hsp70 family protein, partial [Bifidobacteriaceae bacterium]|nr:Hsp70 family protein [Bifidobacteriaceae bacterium]
PRGIPQIEVTFDIDANGIVHVSAKDRGTGKEQSMTISGGSALPKEEIDRMVKDAEAHAAEDKQRREEADTRNSAEQLVYQTEALLKDLGDKIPEDLKTEVDQKITAVKTALEGEDIEPVRQAQSELSESAQKIGQLVYAQQQAEEASGSASSGTDSTASSSSAKEEDIVDAEVIDEDQV